MKENAAVGKAVGKVALPTVEFANTQPHWYSTPLGSQVKPFVVAAELPIVSVLPASLRNEELAKTLMVEFPIESELVVRMTFAPSEIAVVLIVLVPVMKPAAFILAVDVEFAT